MYIIIQDYIEKNKIVENSLIHKNLLMSENGSFIEHVGKEIALTDHWSDLPSKLWIYSNEKSY